MWVLSWGVEDKEVDELGYKSWLKDAWGCSGTSQLLHDTVKSGVTAVATRRELANWMTSACHHWGRSAARSRLCFPLWVLQKGLGWLQSTEQHIHSGRASSAGHVLSPPLWTGQQAAVRQPNKIYEKPRKSKHTPWKAQGGNAKWPVCSI